jgi:hypothetical protein
MSDRMREGSANPDPWLSRRRRVNRRLVFGLCAHGLPGSLHVRHLRARGANRYPHHPASIKLGRGEIGNSRAVDHLRPGAGVAIQGITRQPRRLVAHAHGLQGDRSEHTPVCRGRHALRQRSRIRDVASRSRA